MARCGLVDMKQRKMSLLIGSLCCYSHVAGQYSHCCVIIAITGQ